VTGAPDKDLAQVRAAGEHHPGAKSWRRLKDSPGRRRMRRPSAAFLFLVLVLALGACSSPSHRAPAAAATPTATGSSRPSPDPTPASSRPSPDVKPVTSRSGPDPQTAAALVRIAQVFNDNYDHNNDGPAYDRWDSRSQAVISRAEYIRRHVECPAPQVSAQVENATSGPGGAWLVHYEIGGQQLTDYWFYAGRRWLFDLLLSNPDAARLYRLPFANYAAQVGCQNH
jgi:hypothetical protein